jgi:hypothetical protein
MFIRVAPICGLPRLQEDLNTNSASEKLGFRETAKKGHLLEQDGPFGQCTRLLASNRESCMCGSLRANHRDYCLAIARFSRSSGLMT